MLLRKGEIMIAFLLAYFPELNQEEHLSEGSDINNNLLLVATIFK